MVFLLSCPIHYHPLSTLWTACTLQRRSLWFGFFVWGGLGWGWWWWQQLWQQNYKCKFSRERDVFASLAPCRECWSYHNYTLLLFGHTEKLFMCPNSSLCISDNCILLMAMMTTTMMLMMMMIEDKCPDFWRSLKPCVSIQCFNKHFTPVLGT